MARWLARDGAAVRVWDSRAEPPQAAGLREHVPQRRAARRRARRRALSPVSIASSRVPGLAPGDERIAAVLGRGARRQAAGPGRARAVRRRARVASHARADYAPKVIAVTGTNGKTTTTALTALLVERSGRRVAVAGNIGPTMLQTLADAIDAGPADSLRERLPRSLGARAVELPARRQRRERLRGRRGGAAQPQRRPPRLARLDGRLRGRQGARLRHARDDRRQPRRRRRDAARAGAEDVAGDARAGCRRSSPRRVVSFGAACRRAPTTGAWRSRTTWRGWFAPRATRRRTPAARSSSQHLMPADALRIRGRHNALNALAALALASAIGCPLAPMLHALREYRGEPHRVEHVATSTASTPSTTARAPTSARPSPRWSASAASARRRKLVVILGGDGKGQDFAPLAAPLARHARAVLTIGRDAAAIERVDRRAGVPFERCATLEAAVDGGVRARRARRRGAAQPGLRQPRHVPQLRASRRGLRRRGAGGRADTAKGAASAVSAARRRARRACAMSAASPTRGSLARAPRGAAAARRRDARRPRRRAVVEPIPVREWISVDRGQPARLLGFDRTLVCVVVALLALGLVMVYSASVALPDNPKFARYTPTYFLSRHLAVHGASRSSPRWSRCRCRSRSGRSSRPGSSSSRCCCSWSSWCPSSARASTARAAGSRSAS